MGKSLSSKAKKGRGGSRKHPKGLAKGSACHRHVIGRQQVGEDSLRVLARAVIQLGDDSQAERPPQHERPKRKGPCQAKGKQPAGHS